MQTPNCLQKEALIALLLKIKREEIMIGRLNHVAIAVPDLQVAAAQYATTLGAKVGLPQDEPDHGVTVVFIELPNTKIELLYPLGESSPIQKFLDKKSIRRYSSYLL